MIDTHDPYLNTVKRSLNDAKIKTRKEKIKDTEEKPKGFWAKNIILSDYIYLPESLQQFFLLVLFITIPYLSGIIILYIILNYEEFTEYSASNFDSFMLTWTVGYETIALVLLILITKSAFTFKRK